MYWFIGIALASVLIPTALWIAAFLMYAYGPRIPSKFEQQYDQVREGMTIEEVRAILGPETREVSESALQIHDGDRVRNAVFGDRVLVWGKHEEYAHIGFTAGVLVSKYRVKHDL